MLFRSKILFCGVFAAAMLVACAYAAEDEPDETEVPNVEDDSTYNIDDSTPPPQPLQISDTDSDTPGDSGVPNAEQDDLEDPTPSPALTPASVSTPEPTTRQFTLAPEAYAEETPEPTAEAEEETDESNLTALDLLTGIYGCMIFFVIVILAYFGYKFFSMFFPV